MFKIVLADGTELNNLIKNGDNFIAHYNIDPSIFENNLSPTNIIEDEETELHEHMDLVQLIQNGNEIWFVLRDLTDRELLDISMQASIDYIAMMLDIDMGW